MLANARMAWRGDGGARAVQLRLGTVQYRTRGTGTTRTIRIVVLVPIACQDGLGRHLTASAVIFLCLPRRDGAPSQHRISVLFRFRALEDITRQHFNHSPVVTGGVLCV